MEATELMIGDWVLYGATQIKVQHLYNDGHDDCVAEVTELCLDNFLEEPSEQEREIYLKSVEPIPLTSEILEKNGFEKRWEYKDHYFVLPNAYYYLTIAEWFDSIFVLKCESNELSTPHIQMTISYLHEFQHALRLCGIDKEIKL